MLDEPQVHQNAKSVLIKRFGDKCKLTKLFKSELRSWPAIKAGDRSSFFFYHSFILHCLESRTRPILTPYDGQRRWDSNLQLSFSDEAHTVLCEAYKC